MLEVQKYLHSGKTLEDLTNELAIKVTAHPTLPLIILNYDQIESTPKTHPIVRECRALVLNSTDYSLVAKSMTRFFNWGEVQEEMPLFDFSNFIIQTKEDGSLCVIYNFEGKWYANTRGSFATDNIQFCDFSWREGFEKALGGPLDSLDLNPALTYVCEFCSPWNKVVRRYAEPQMYLLTTFRGETECTWDETDEAATACLANFWLPKRFDFKNIEEVQLYLQDQATNDPTYEGVVLRDVEGRRHKVKSATYLGLHRLKGEGDNMFNPKHLLPFILAGEEDELLTYFEEVRCTFYESKCKVLEEYIRLLEVWIENKDIESQKDFALSILNKTPFTGLLFTVRKEHGSDQKVAHLKQEWREATNAILKNVFKV